MNGPDSRVLGAAAPEVPVPRYGEASLADLLPSVLAALGVPGEPNVLGLAPTRRACVLLIDGLGWELLRDHPAEAPFLSGLLAGSARLTAGFPATTSTSLGSVGTGLPPGVHGLLGYLVAVPGEGRLMNSLRWDAAIEPRDWQPHRTVFERAEAAEVAASHVSAAAFAGSGLTVAALRGARYVPAETAGERVAGALAALGAADRSLVYVYYGDLDATGHSAGTASTAWSLQLAHTDRLVEQLASRLPAGTTLYVTADHGMVDVPAEARRDFDALPALADGVALLGGEGRARHVYARPGAADDVLDCWRDMLADGFWVRSRAEAIAAGWFGGPVPERLLARIGDVVVAAHGDGAVVASRAEPNESRLIGMHGSMTSAEQWVPLLVAGR
jgi:hypothetical protein